MAKRSAAMPMKNMPALGRAALGHATHRGFGAAIHELAPICFQDGDVCGDGARWDHLASSG